MAADPLAGYEDTPPDPLAGYVEPKTAGEAASDFGRAAANTFGVGDRLVAGWHTVLPAMYPSLFGGNATGPVAKDAATMGSQYDAAVEAEKAKTAQANAALGPVGSFAANMVGGLPAGYLGVAGGATEAIAPTAVKALGSTVGPYVARLIGGAGEGLGMSLLGDAGRGDQPGAHNAVSALIGTLANAFGGRGVGKPPVAPARADLETAKATALTNLAAPKFDPAVVEPAWNDAEAALTGDQRANLSFKMKQAVANQKAENSLGGGQNGTPASVINGFARKIFAHAISPDDQVYAAKIRDNLANGPNSVLATAPTISGHQVGEAAQLNNAFNTAHARLEDHDWLSNASINTAPAEAAAALQKGSGMLLDPAGKESLQNLADFAPKQVQPSTNPVAAAAKAVGSSLWGDLSNKAVPAVVALSGFPLTAAGVAGVKAGGAGAKAAWDAMGNAAKQRAIDAAQVATTTGVRTTPLDMRPAAPVRRFISGALAGPEANPPGQWSAYSP
jgi:hypothetical protein